MTTRLRPARFDLLGIDLVDIGPLRGSTHMAFTDASGRSTNLFLMMGPNGSGKTTILDSVFCAMELLGGYVHEDFGLDSLDDGTGGLQLDARVELDDGERTRPYVLSIVAGNPGLLRTWSRKELDEVDATEQISVFYTRPPRGPVQLSAPSHSTATGLVDAIVEQGQDAPQDLFETVFAYPTVLYFTADRGIRRPPLGPTGVIRPNALHYRSTHRFDVDGATWEDSLDNLFVWYAWLDNGREGREAQCRKLVNDLVFRNRKRLGPVDRQNLYVPVEFDGLSHRLDRLSSGERQLVQFVVRVASHMTGSTIVLIDEMEQHLHTVLQRRLLNIMKTWASEHKGLSFMTTSHQKETFRRLAVRVDEPGLVKGGVLVKPRYSLPE